jgi:hypothetical protein
VQPEFFGGVTHARSNYGRRPAGRVLVARWRMAGIDLGVVDRIKTEAFFAISAISAISAVSAVAFPCRVSAYLPAPGTFVVTDDGFGNSRRGSRSGRFAVVKRSVAQLAARSNSREPVSRGP